MRGSNAGGVSFVAYGRIGKDGRVTIPASIRRRLGLRTGDELHLAEVSGSVVMVRTRTRLDVALLRALESTLSEWNSPEDEEAFRDL